MTRAWQTSFGWLYLLALPACGGSETRPLRADAGASASLDAGSWSLPDAPPVVHALPAELRADELTYHQHVKPILAARCVGCHADGALAPFALEDYAETRAAGHIVSRALGAETMPPFAPRDESCRALDDARNMPDRERAIVEAWVANGMPEGDLTSAESVHIDEPSDVLAEPSARFLAGERYTPSAADALRHRCFVIDPGLSTTTSFVALGTRASSPRLFVSSLVYAVFPGADAQLNALDRADEAAGYACYWSSGVAGAILVGGSSAGFRERALPQQTSLTLPAGTKLVIEVDYASRKGPLSDQPALALWRAPNQSDAISPSSFVIANTAFTIRAGERDANAQASGRFVAENALSVDPGEARAGLVWGAGVHMHVRGKAAKLELVHANGTRECLLDIPRWNEAFQGSYRFREPLRVQAGDTLALDCHWDNGADAQPSVDGQRLAPRDVGFGADVLDETCVGSVLLTAP